MPRIPALPLSHLSRLALVPLILVPLCAAHDFHDWQYQETHKDSREFTSGGMVHVHLKVGDLHIRRGDAGKIGLRYTVKSYHEHNVKESSVDFDIRGSEATIDFHAPTSNTDFDVELEVPANTNVDVHMKVGDLTVENVEGDKDLELGVGDIRVTREPATYHRVRASTGIGDVNSDGYGDTSGWLGKTLKYNGDGKYELRAHVGVGDITLEGK
jgi:Putative adhesin